MKRKFLGLLLVLTILSGCQKLQELNTTKPVDLDGFGSLSNLKDKELTENQLEKLFDSLSQAKSVNESDAESLLDIYRTNRKKFISFSGSSFGSGQIVKYLSLILQYEKLRDEVKHITDSAMVEQIQRLATFSEQSDRISALSGDYLIAALKTFGKNEELREELIAGQQTTNSIVIVQGFEAKAFELTVSSDAMSEQKQNADKFLSDLRTYNDSLPADSKILDSNGRLINPPQMTEKQRGRVEKIFNSDESAAGRGLYERMEKMRDALRNETNLKLR